MNEYPPVKMDKGYMNYTQLVELYGEEYNLAPRTHLVFPPRQEKSPALVDTPGYTQINHGRLYHLDLKRESDIKVGTSWKYNDLKGDQCVLTSDYAADPGVRVGERIAIVMDLTDVWLATATIYNLYVKGETAEAVNTADLTQEYTVTYCTVMAFVSKPDGKFASNQFVEQIIMGDFETWLLTAFSDTVFTNGDQLP